VSKTIDVEKAVQHGFSIGISQQYDEIFPFSKWLAARAPENIAEIGTYLGGTCAILCEIASGICISIDLPEGPFGSLDQASCEKRNNHLKKLYPNFTGILGDSRKRLTAELLRGLLLKKNKLDLLFIDGDHSYEGVKKDYMMYREFVRPGGAIAFHDVGDTKNHKNVGCEVPKLWKELKGKKIEFNAHHPWGGIGVLLV